MFDSFFFVRLLAIVCAVLIVFVALRIRRVNRMREDVEFFIARFAELERRAGLIETEAVTYVNSMNSDVSAALYEIRQILARARELALGAEEFLGMNSYYGLSRAWALVRSDILGAVQLSERALPDQLSSQWEIRLEHLFQFVGMQIAEAAVKAARFGYSGGGLAEATLSRLTAAGIMLNDSHPDD